MKNEIKGYIGAAVMTAASAVVLIAGGIISDSRRSLPEAEIIAVETAAPETAESIEGRENLVNINTAGKEELMTLKGIGEKLALAIIEYRDITPFSSPDDLLEVNGIGEKKLAEIRDDICV